MNLNVTAGLLGILLCLAAFAADKPKYGPKTTPLNQDHEYLQKHPAPDFWALSSFYQAQRDERSCTLATMASMVNSFRAMKPMSADDKLAQQGELLDRVNHEGWNRMFKQNGKTVTLDELTQIAVKALKLYGIDKKAEGLHVDSVDEKATAKIRDLLIQNEKSASDQVMVNVDRKSVV